MSGHEQRPWESEGITEAEYFKARYLEARREVGGWLPISEAPRDGTHILACNASRPISRWGAAPPTVVHFHPDPEQPGFYTSVNELAPEKTYPATHFHPLPTPPRAPQEKK